MKTVSIVSITAISLLLLAGCRDAEEERDEIETNDPDADSASLRREAMKEWFDEAHDTADPSTPWSSDYRKFLLDAAGRERQAWADLLPTPQARVSGTTWINIGPTKANWERNGNTLNVTDSGRTRTILIDGTRVYLATAGGGVWRTDDGGGTWTPITETLGSLSCGSLAMDPANHRTLYLGLGDPFDGTGIGLVKSTNGGDSWSAPVFLGAATIIPQVIVDSSDSNVVLAATDKGLYRSTDAGASFSPVSLATGQAGLPYVWSIDSIGPGAFVLSLEAAPSATTTTTDGQIWTSGDHGATWTRATGVSATTGVGRITVAAAPSNRQVVYAMAAVPNRSSGLDLADLFKSTDGGRTWTALGARNKGYTNANSESSTLTTLLNGQGWYNQLVLVDPTDPNTAYFGGALLVTRTTDGGATFTQVTNWLAQYGLPYVHADVHSGAIDASGKIYIGSDGGLFVSADHGATFSSAMNVGLVTHLLYSVGSSPANTAAVIGGMQDNGTRVREGTTSIFNQPLGGDGFGSNVNRSNASLMLSSLYYDQIYKSTDGGKTFRAAVNGLAEANNPSAAPFITRIVPWLGSATGNEIFTFTNTKVYKTTDYATSWSAIGTFATSGIYLRGVGVAASNVGVIGVIGTGGRVYVSTNGGSTWAMVASGKAGSTGALPNNNLSLSDILFDPANPSTIYVASVAATPTASHLWKSTNSGATWAIIDGTGAANGFPTGIGVNTIKADPDTSDGTVLYAGTQLGVYRSTNGGATWSRFGAGMPLVSVTDFYISPDSSLMRAATFGRGFWELTGAAAPSTNDFSLSASPTGVSIVRGTSAAITVSTAVTSGSAESVSLSAGSLPAGATATFAPASVSAGGSTTLTLATLPSTAPGTYSVVVTGTAPSRTHSTTVTLTVTAPATGADFGISASPTSLQVNPGGSAQTTVSTAVVSGSAEVVSLRASGLPSGATATFTPASVTAGGVSTLRLTAGSATPAGTYAVTVTGTSPSVSHTTPVTFTVASATTAADFGISASPASLSIAAGGKAQTTIQTTVLSGSDQVALSIAGLPAGVTAAFSPASVAAGASATLTFTAGATVKAGSYALLLTGKGSTATHMTPVSLTVAATPAARSSPAAGGLGCSTGGQGGEAGGGALLLGLGLALMDPRRRLGRT